MLKHFKIDPMVDAKARADVALDIIASGSKESFEVDCTSCNNAIAVANLIKAGGAESEWSVMPIYSDRVECNWVGPDEE